MAGPIKRSFAFTFPFTFAFAFAFTFTFTFTFPFASAWAEGRPTYGGSAHVALSAAPTGIDSFSPLLADQELAALIFDSPFKLDDTGTPRPQLAVSLDPPPPAPAAPLGPLRARLKVRTDVKFHDGTLLRAGDVAASLERALRDPAGWMLAPVRSVRAIGDDTVELELLRPAPDLALLLSTPAAAVAPAGGVARRVGTGPFALERGGTPADVRLTAFDACFAGRPFLDAVDARAFPSRLDEAQSFEAGALDLARHSGGGLPNGARRASVTHDGPQTLTGYLALGKSLPDELAAALKAGLNAGLDRERLRRLVREPARAIPAVAPDAGAPAKLRILVARRPGWKPALLVDQSRADDKPLAERLLVELSKMGVELTIDAVPADVYRARLAARAYDLALGVAAPPAPGLADLALLAVVDPAAARAILQRAPAPAAVPELDAARIVPLYRRAARVVHAPELRGVTVDAAGRVSLADAYRAAR